MRISSLRVLLLAVAVPLLSCGNINGVVPSDGGQDGSVPDAGDGGTDGGNQAVVIHYHRALADYDGWTLTAQGAVPASATATGTDAFGSTYSLNVPAGTSKLTLAFAKGGTTDPTGSIEVAPVPANVWVFSGYNKSFNHAPPVLPTATTYVLYYSRPDKTYTDWGLHLWGELVTGTQWPSPLQPTGTDPDYGAAFSIARATGELGNCSLGNICLIVHKGDEKDPGPDMKWDPKVLGNIVFVTSKLLDLSAHPVAATAFGINGASAHMLSRSILAWDTSLIGGSSYELRISGDAGISVSDGGIVGGDMVLPLVKEPTGMPPALADLAPYAANWTAFAMQTDAGILETALKGQLVAVARDPDGKALAATEVQTAFALDDLYATTSAALGPTFASVAGVPSVAVWAPTAQSVKLHVYDATKQEITGSPFAMTASNGVWSRAGVQDWYGKYYRFEVVVYHPATRKIETLTTTDPYSTNLSSNSEYSQFTDLNDPALAPNGWTSATKPALSSMGDVVLYETHIRDFSAFDTSVRAADLGKYLAFADATNTAMRALISSQVTHVHLMPAFDFATINEDPSKRIDIETSTVGAVCNAGLNSVPSEFCALDATMKTVDALKTFKADSVVQQGVAAALSAVDSFNWGYDPLHYGAPEGSYASSAEGTSRIVEFRQMVKTLSDNGLRTVLDVVYNHTNASGVSPNAILDRLVPGYYHRRDTKTGDVLTSSCCANTATEHAMMQRLMADTMVRWATQYKIDGFRFDLMGLHLRKNIVDVKAALNALTMANDGVDGSKIILYGEGWTYDEMKDRGIAATQSGMAGTGVATFNDRLRDGVRGGGPFDNGAALRANQGWATGLVTAPNEMNTAAGQGATLNVRDSWVRSGMAGAVSDFRVHLPSGASSSAFDIDYNGQTTGYTRSPIESINYVAAHDNEELYDIIQYKVPLETSATQRARAQIVALATVVLGEGIPFIHMGDEWLRSKSFDRNSYNSGDWFNQIDWTGATNGWGLGLPPAGDNSGSYATMRPIIAAASARPAASDIAWTRDRFRELLQQRKAQPLLRLVSADDVKKRVDFPNGGAASYIPGLMVMTVTDGTACSGIADLDPGRDAIAVFINAGTATQSFSLPGATGFTLSSLDAQSSVDTTAKTANFQTMGGNGVFTIPGRTAVVFEQPQGTMRGAGLSCNSR